MRVLHLNTEHGWRGGERQTFFTLQGLQKRGVWSGLIAQEGQPLHVAAEGEGIRVFPLKMKGPADMMAAFRIARICKKEKVDILHLQTSHGASLALLSKIFGNKARLVTARRVDFPIRSGWKYNKFERVVPISKAIENILLDSGVDEERIRRIPSGVPVEVSRPEQISALRKEIFGEAAFALGAIGHLTDHKGHRFLIDAMPAIFEKIPEARLAIIGGGELRATLEQQVKNLDLEKKVIFTGFRGDVPELIYTFDLFLHPAKLEGLCTTILDVMLREVPVIASDTGGIPEATGGGRFANLVEPGSQQAIADAVTASYVQKADLDQLQKAKQFVVENFSVEAMVEKTIALYSEIQ